MDLGIGIDFSRFAKMIDQTPEDVQRPIYHRIVNHPQIDFRQNTGPGMILIIGTAVVAIQQFKTIWSDMELIFQILLQSFRLREECSPFPGRHGGFPFSAPIGFHTIDVRNDFLTVFLKDFFSKYIRQFCQKYGTGLDMPGLKERQNLPDRVKAEIRIPCRNSDLDKFFRLICGQTGSFHGKIFQHIVVIEKGESVKQGLVIHAFRFVVAPDVLVVPGEKIFRSQYFLQLVRDGR